MSFNMSGQRGTVPRDFRLQGFSMNQSPPPSLTPFRIFSKIRENIRTSRCTTGAVDTVGRWKKSSIRKVKIMQLTISLVAKMQCAVFNLPTWDGLLDIMDERSTAADAHLGTCKFVTLSPTKMVRTDQ